MATQVEADRTLAAFSESLLDNPNVSYAAVVEDDDGGFVIEVGVLSEELNTDSSALSADDAFSSQMVPASLPIPGEDGIVSLGEDRGLIELKIVQVGPIDIHWQDRQRPAQGGDSISNSRYNSAGTLGAAVTLKSHPGEVFIMSNWHVLVGGSGTKGDSILQQGRLDGGRAPADWVADLTWSALNSKVDLAVAKVRAPAGNYVRLGTTRGHGQIRGARLPAVNMGVKKSGRTTNVTTGTVRSINAAVTVNGYPGGSRRFVNQILTTNMSRPGDSGSVLLSNDNLMVGLLFAGDSSSVTIHNRVDEVNNALRASIASALNGEIIGFEQ